ncbi:hypothetical protein JW859_13640 [bacterium]|nr:hypothetical protein [bacterium]
MAWEVLTVADTEAEIEYIQLLLATEGIITRINQPARAQFREILVDLRVMTLAKAILEQYHERLEILRRYGKT